MDAQNRHLHLIGTSPRSNGYAILRIFAIVSITRIATRSTRMVPRACITGITLVNTPRLVVLLTVLFCSVDRIVITFR